MTKPTKNEAPKTIEFSKDDDFLLQRKLENATEGMQWGWRIKIATLKDPDKRLMADFINELQNTENIRFGTRRIYIMNLFLLVRSANERQTMQVRLRANPGMGQ